MANAKKRRRSKRQAVQKADRVKPTPETAAKLRPHPMELLLAKGRDENGIDADQWQCACEVTDAFDAITRQLGISNRYLDSIVGHSRVAELNSYEERLSVIWFAWSPELVRRLTIRPTVIVELILGNRRLDFGAVPLLGRALDLWAKVRSDTAPDRREVSTIRRPELDKAAVTSLTFAGS
jgi:hypothetical protein